MSLLSTLLLFVLLPEVQAENRVLISRFEADSAETEPVAAMLTARLLEELRGQAGYTLLGVKDLAPVGEQSADIYLRSCPKGEVVGCTFVLAERAGAAYAVTGKVSALQAQSRVDVSIVDVSAAEEALTLGMTITGQDTIAFTDGVKRLVSALVEDAEATRPDPNAPLVDEDDPEDSTGRPKVDRDAARQELEELGQELGAIGDVSMSGRALDRPRLTEADIRRESRTDAVKPWERLGMGADEYLRYKNSGYDLMEWRARRSGRALQLVLRPQIGFASGPYSQRYLGWYLYDGNSATSIIEVYAFQASQKATAFTLGGSVGLGLTSTLEIEAEVAQIYGSYLLNYRQDQEDKPIIPEDDESYANASTRFGASVRVVPFPTHNVRPALAVGAFAWRGTSVDQHARFSDSSLLPVFPAPTAYGVQVKPGVEARLSSHLDLYAQLPLLLFLGGLDANVEHQGGEYYQELQVELEEPGEATHLGVGLDVGVQVRLFGKKPKAQKEYEEEEEL